MPRWDQIRYDGRMTEDRHRGHFGVPLVLRDPSQRKINCRRTTRNSDAILAGR